MKRMAAPLVLAIGWILALIGQDAQAADVATAKTPLGRQVNAFELRDYRGKAWKLDEFKDKRAVVVAFLGTQCPLATLYAPRLVQMAAKFADRDVAFIGINANQQDSISQLAAYAKQHEISFPLLKDVGNVVADQMGAVRTPEVFVLDRERKVRYWGRIDDQYLIGRQRSEPTRHDLAVALEEVLSDKPVSQPVSEAVGCRIGRTHKPQANASVTYTKDVAPLLNKHCVECHRDGEIAPFALTKYSEVAGWADTIVEVTGSNLMPPWHANPEYGHFANDRRLTDAEKKCLNDWVQAGAPEGNPKDLPEPPKFADGWRLPRVDKEFFIADKPFDVPAEGEVKYQYFEVDPGFTEDMWVQGAQCRPGNRAVVHHIIVAARGKSKDRKGRPGALTNAWLTATAPGARPLLLPDGMAKFIPAGSKLVFQMHYTPNGSPQKDRSSVALMFTEAKNVKKEVGTLNIENHFFLIPPRAADYRTEAWYHLKRDMVLLSFFPHMHLRGKSFRYEVEYPDGTKEVLLDVPKYDFAWQSTYELEQPKLLPRNTKVHCVAHYDNSTDNVANPNPDRFVIWGDQTWEEMMIGYMDMTVPDKSIKAEKPPAKKALDKSAATSN